jgi:hypothetical protein
MKPSLASLTIAAAAALVLREGVAHATAPTTADCLAASDASFQSRSEHKLRAERSQLLVCASASCPAEVRKECVNRVDGVNGQIPTIIFAAKDASGADLSAVKVTMDSEVLAESLEGTALAIDPGEHTFTFEAAGLPPVTAKYVIQQAQKDRHELVRFGAPAPTPAPGPSTLEATSSQPPPSPAAEGHGLGTQKILAIVAGGVGIVGLGVGTAFGVMALSQKSDAQSLCSHDPCSDRTGVNEWSTADSSGNVSTVGFVVGGIALAGGAVLWFTAPSLNRGSSTQVGFGPGSLQLKGTW